MSVDYKNLFDICIENSNDLFLLLNKDLAIKEINPSAEKTLGWAKDKVLGKKINELFEKTFSQPLIEKELIKSSKNISITVSFMIDNKKNMFSWKVFLSSQGSKENNLILVTGQNITQSNVNSLEDLKLESVLQYAPGLFYWKDKNSVYQGCNDEFSRLAGLKSRDEVKGKTDFDLIWKDRANLYVDVDRSVIHSGQPRLNHEEIVAISENKTMTAITNKVPLRNHNGEIIGLLGITMDITHQKQIEHDLKISKESAETALQAMRDAQTEEQRQREKSEKLAIENAKHKAQLDAQTQFISTIDKVAHDSESPLGSLVTLTEYLGGIEEVSTVDGYNIALMTEQERIKDTLYLAKDDTGLHFAVLGTDGTLKKGHVSWEQILTKLKSHFPKDSSDTAIFQKQCLAVLLDILIENKLIETGVNEKRIPEEYRIDLREAVEKINDIMADLLLRYRPNADDASESKQLTIISTVLTQLISEKRMSFHSKSIEIKEDFAPESLFAFVNIQRTQVNRALSNLMNNASQAFDSKPGIVTLKLACDNEFVYVSVGDNGKGMPPGMVEKIKNKIAFTEGKKEGHGIGLEQVRDTLERNHAKMSIESEAEKGTQFTLVFSKKQPPAWAIDKIQVKPHDTVLILDDDKSIHGAWDLRFKSLSKQYPSLKFHHFFIGEELLKFLPTLAEENKKHLLLLTDYELLNQKETGISVIEQSKIKRSILVTSHYVKREIQDKVVLLGVKLLPKKLVSHVPIVIQEDITQTVAAKKIDAIWLDDDVSFAQGIKRSVFMGCELAYFSNPNELKEKITAYDKGTPILLDNNYEPPFSTVKGIDLAKEFHEQGFTRLYLITGERFAAGTIPDYITVIPKSDLPDVKKTIGLK